jgi:hypothetical protein
MSDSADATANAAENATANVTATATAAGGPINTVPASAFSKFAPQTPFTTALALANNRPVWYNLNNNPDAPFWWLVVVDLTNLQPVANVLGDGVNVPPAVQQYYNNPRYFLYCISNCQTGAQIPFGAFYQFLQQVGSGPGLAQLEQVYRQFSSGIIHYYSYILAATMDTTDYPGFESLSFTGPATLAMAFMPYIVNNQQVYVPINPFTS